ncbi:putative structural protein - phage associated [Claveliimonas bilis]|uniref:phage major tail protein, TP901-1 family n=1 Tax=Claveliimonas bilis TaxID=3028070 RepID=UPI001E5151E9|nr:phage major tail protein, TP901-1 family [Claveliimonas bilis]BCZ26359.1 putative structural protein - phage associated [Claveliimonas bilis]
MILTREMKEKLARHYDAPEFKEYPLQVFAEAVQGKKIVYLYRVASKEATANGTTLAFTTENSRTMSKDADSTATKDGSIRTPGTAEVEITATSILAKGDTLLDELEKAMDKDELMEVWEANLDEPAEEGENKFKGKYFQGYLTEFEKTSSAEDFVECNLTFGINGSGADGDVTVSVEQQEVAAYVFKDTQKTGA